MAKASRDKGARGELEVAEKFRAWWEPHEPGVVFRRTPMSGGWAAKGTRDEFGTAGDLVTTSKSFPFCVEVKRRENWSWNTLLAGKKSPVWGWWAQAMSQANEQQKLPLLVFRKSRQPWTVFVPAIAVFLGPSEIVLRDNVVVGIPVLASNHWGAMEPSLISLAEFLKTSPASWLDAERACASFLASQTVEDGGT